MNPVCHSSGCRKIATMEAATINAYGETWLPYCEVHLAVIVAQEALLVRRIGKQPVPAKIGVEVKVSALTVSVDPNTHIV